MMGDSAASAHPLVLATHAALQRYPTANEVQLRWELVGHLCRCNAYDKIMAAVQAARQQRLGAS